MTKQTTAIPKAINARWPPPSILEPRAISIASLLDVGYRMDAVPHTAWSMRSMRATSTCQLLRAGTAGKADRGTFGGHGCAAESRSGSRNELRCEVAGELAGRADGYQIFPQ
jgi:hypothetical protein